MNALLVMDVCCILPCLFIIYITNYRSHLVNEKLSIYMASFSDRDATLHNTNVLFMVREHLPP
jgi:hypothetical protein